MERTAQASMPLVRKGLHGGVEQGKIQLSEPMPFVRGGIYDIER